MDQTAIFPAASQVTQNRDIRRLGLNLNHWYVAARSIEVQSQPVGITFWHNPIVLYRDESGKVHALEDRCPHRQVKLSHGQVVSGSLECAYHGWHFNSRGECASVPALAADQKLPQCKIRAYPVQELDGFIWLFPGNLPPESVAPLGIPEWEHLNYIATVSVIHCQAHYSFLIENLMDMHHGHLHQDWQAWKDAVLQEIHEERSRVDAYYQAESYYQIDKIWSISQLFFPALRHLHPESLTVSYIYPHWMATLGQDFKIYCLLCPMDETETHAYLVHFTSLHAFERLHQLPINFRRWIKDRLFGAAQKLLDGLVRQDILMIEEEQQAYLQNPGRKNYEVNRALMSVQRLMRHQLD